MKRYAHGSKADISIGDFHVLVFGDCSLSAFLFPLFSRTLVRFCFNLFLVSCVCYSNLVRGISLDLLFSFFFFHFETLPRNMSGLAQGVVLVFNILYLKLFIQICQSDI